MSKVTRLPVVDQLTALDIKAATAEWQKRWDDFINVKDPSDIPPPRRTVGPMFHVPWYTRWNAMCGTSLKRGDAMRISARLGRKLSRYIPKSQRKEVPSAQT